MEKVCPPLFVRHASVDQDVKVPFTLIKVILSCHPTWRHVKRPRNHTSQQLNWQPFESSFSKCPFRSTQFSKLLTLGAARKSILEIVQLEQIETPDVRRMDPETLQKLTESIVAYYTFLNPATTDALDDFVATKTSFLISGGSIVLSLPFIKPKFPFFYRQARALCCAPCHFFVNRSGQFIHVTDPDSDSSFLIIFREEFTALPALTREALLKTEANALFTYSAEDEEKL